MSRSSAPEAAPPAKSRGRSRGQVEPLAALAAVLVVGIALSSYALAVEGVAPGSGDRDRAGPALDRVTDRVATGGVVDPAALDGALAAVPPGYEARITLSAGEHTWSVGPAAPPGADAAARPVGVRLGPARVRAGRIRLEVWT